MRMYAASLSAEREHAGKRKVIATRATIDISGIGNGLDREFSLGLFNSRVVRMYCPISTSKLADDDSKWNLWHRGLKDPVRSAIKRCPGMEWRAFRGARTGLARITSVP